jgi:transglutaminase-like putative cysteine protease
MIQYTRSLVVLILLINSAVAAADDEYAAIDKKAALLSKHPASINTLADEIKRRGTNDLERARLIFKWITANIRYDNEAAGKDISAAFQDQRSLDDMINDTFRERKGVCGDMSYLYLAVARKAGLEAYSILGWAYRPGEPIIDGGFRGVPNHRWNAVKINGTWKLFDLTGGQFCIPPEEMIRHHYPVVPYWQLLDRTVTMKIPVFPPFEGDDAKKSRTRLTTKQTMVTYIKKGMHRVVLDNPLGLTLYGVVVKGDDPLKLNLAVVEKKNGSTVMTYDFTNADTNDVYYFIITDKTGMLYFYFVVLKD